MSGGAKAVTLEEERRDAPLNRRTEKRLPVAANQEHLVLAVHQFHPIRAVGQRRWTAEKTDLETNNRQLDETKVQQTTRCTALNSDSIDLKDTTSVGASEPSDFTAHQFFRQEKLDAIRRAKEIWASDEVLDSEKTHVSPLSMIHCPLQRRKRQTD